MSTEILTPNTRINRYSDFRLVITMTKDGEAYVPAQFRFIFYVEDWDDCHGRYTASCIKGITTNCAVEDSSITVFFNSPNFNLGELKCRFYDITDNGNFADGTLDTCTPVTLPVEIVSGAGDAEVVNISVQYAGSGSIDIDTSDFMTKSTYTYPIDQLNPRIAGKIQYWAIPDQVVDYIDGIGDAHIATTGTIYGAANGSVYMAKRSGEQLLYSAEDRVIFNKEDGHLYTYDGEAWAQVGGSSSGGEGTVTAVKMNNGTPIEPDEDGVVNLGTVITQHQDISGKANSADLATVATSGSYNDLQDKPNIPAGVTVDSTITQNGTNPVQGGAIYSALEGKEDRQVEIINLYYDGGELTWTNSSGDSMTIVQVNTLLRNSSKNVIIKATFDDIGDVDGTRLYYRTSPIDDDYMLFYALEYNIMYWLGLDADSSDYSYLALDDTGATDVSSFVPQTRTINGNPLSSDITLTASDVGAQSTISDLATIRSGASAGATALQPSDVSVETPSTPDGTVDISVGNDTYTINLNHTHEGMAKLVVCEESDLPSTLEEDTIYGVEEDGEISVLYVGGVPFYGGGGGGTSTPVLRQPTDGSTIDVGKIETGQSSVTKTITVKGKNLTQALTVAVTGTGYSVNKQSISAADANVGTTLTITCTSTADDASGTLSLASSEVSCDCDLVANKVQWEDLTAVKLTGSQWMQTDYYPNALTEFEVDLKFEENANTGVAGVGMFLFRASNTTGSNRFDLNNGSPSSSPNGTYFLVFHSDSKVTTPDFTDRKSVLYADHAIMKYTIGASKGEFYFNGDTNQIDKKSGTTAVPMAIGYDIQNQKPYQMNDWTIYRFTLKENGAAVRNYLPKRRNGIPGLYDTVTGAFISSETSTELVAVE